MAVAAENGPAHLPEAFRDSERLALAPGADRNHDPRAAPLDSHVLARVDLQPPQTAVKVVRSGLATAVSENDERVREIEAQLVTRYDPCHNQHQLAVGGLHVVSLPSVAFFILASERQ